MLKYRGAVGDKVTFRSSRFPTLDGKQAVIEAPLPDNIFSYYCVDFGVPISNGSSDTVMAVQPQEIGFFE